MGSACVWLLALILCWGLPSPHITKSHAAVYYVTPYSESPNPECPSSERPCLTLNEYAQGNILNGDDLIMLLFLNGEHNLNAQNFEIDHKTSLKMSPSQAGTEVVINLSCGMSMTNVFQVEFTELKFFSLTNQSDNFTCTLGCLSVSEVNLLSVTRVSIEFCQLFLQGRINATIIGLTASSSSVFSLPNSTNHTVTIRGSNFYFSNLTISDSSVSQLVIVGDNIVSALSFESSTMSNSLLIMIIQTHIIYELSILNTSITSRETSDNFKTGIKVATFQSTTLYAMIKNSIIVGNGYGITFTAEEDSHVELSVDQCHIKNNSGGLVVSSQSQPRYPQSVSDQKNAASITRVTSTILSGNKNSQIILLKNYGSTNFTVFNCTIIGKQVSGAGHDATTGSGANFQVGYETSAECHGTFINLTQNVFEDNSYGVTISSAGKVCNFDVHFKENTVISSQRSGLYDTGVGLQFSSYDVGGNNVINATIANCHFSHNQGGAIEFQYISSTVSITNTTFAQNRHGILLKLQQQNMINMVINDSVLEQNDGLSLGVLNPKRDSSKTATIVLQNVTLFNNTHKLPDAGVIQVDSSIELSIENLCTFRNNQGTVIQALTTEVSLSGEISFENNVAFQGGAISLSYSALLRLKLIQPTKTSILFVNNTATIAGGSIFVGQSENLDSSTGSICFYDLEKVTLHELKDAALDLVFINNTATNGGGDIYGGTPNSNCIIASDNLGNCRNSYCIKDYIFKTSSSVSSISSDPKRVCLCDSLSRLMCANHSHIFHNISRYPGEVFSLSLAVVGLEFGTVTGPVYAKLLPRAGDLAFLGKDQYVRQIDYKTCAQLNFTVSSHNPKETIVLTVNNTVITRVINSSDIESAIEKYNEKDLNHMIPFSLITVPVYINIALLECPPGFQLSKGKCECNNVLRNIGISDCAIYNRTAHITRSGNQWINISNESIVFSNYCPFYYCNQSSVNLNLNNPDEQCVISRSGILCGACSTNLTFAIGSSRCLNCSNNYYILLLIAFAAAGVLLVLFIKILDVTVTTGTLNGLIFYANIIWAHQSLLFPPQSKTSPLLQFLKAFIAWLNLDLGIETCFIQYLDGYWKTWLQFVFPAYIWLIAGLIIVLSHYSIRITKFLGDSSVSILATLFLLSYAKLLRTILIILNFTELVYPDSLQVVWSFDGNVSYLDTKHSILFSVAVVILLVLWLPCTFVLLFIQCLRKYSHHFLLRWINKLNPLFDSYLGPLKDKHHYWIGLGLLARLVLFLSSAITATTVPLIAPVMISLTAVLFCLLVLSVYKQWLLSVLESCFLINMAMFATALLFIEAKGGSKDTLACTSLGTAFILFVAIIAYHVWRRCRIMRRQQMNISKGCENIDNSIVLPQESSTQQSITYQEVSVPELREPLLDEVTM